MELMQSNWITPAAPSGSVCPVFRRVFRTDRPVAQAVLEITALGVYEAELNGRRVGDFILAPGWTSYGSRLQVQSYDVTGLLAEENDLRVTVGRGWFRSPMPGWFEDEDKRRRFAQPCGLIALLTLRYADGIVETLPTDETWASGDSPIRFSEIYDGETCDARAETAAWQPVRLLAWPKDILIPQEGEIVRETERVAAQRVFLTPGGDRMVDFGQEVTGYVEFTVEAGSGDEVFFDHAEVLDREGNFYNENYRSAKAEVRYICRDGRQTWHPRLTFFGFRYIRLRAWPGEASPEQFTAVVVHSDLKRAGWLESGCADLNRLFSNIVWGQRGNFLDVPTDCPQRDERLGWTGDAQIFIRAACYLFDTERFFRKWFRDMSADQRADGAVGQVIPDVMPAAPPSAAWGDAAVICPWQVFQSYGDPAVLEEQYTCMRRWVDYITASTGTPGLWTGGKHFSDWLGLDSPPGSYKGSSREDLIASAYYAHSVDLLIRAGKRIGRDVSGDEALYRRIVAAFRAAYPVYVTQTEHVLAVRFGLAEDPQRTADDLAALVRADGTRLRTGFLGTAYILHVLSDYGHAGLAWDLLLRREYPGWLYPVTKGATTVWEHWDGIREDGTFWSRDMNSYNHYAYGAVADWIFEKAAGISHDEEHPGFTELLWQPLPDPRAGWLTASLHTRHGLIRASWRYEGDAVRYELKTPVPARVRIGGEVRSVQPGRYVFWGR